MTLSDRIRRAALGPTQGESISDWLPLYSEEWDAAHYYQSDGSGAWYPFKNCTNTERRMFLLFVAEAIDGRHTRREKGTA